MYTKKGDRGTTCLVGGQQVDKNDQRIEAFGTVDELNSFVGLACVDIAAELPPSDVCLRTLAHACTVRFVRGCTPGVPLLIFSASALRLTARAWLDYV